MIGVYNEKELARMRMEDINNARATCRRASPAKNNRRSQDYAKKMTECDEKKQKTADSKEKKQSCNGYVIKELDDSFPPPQEIFGLNRGKKNPPADSDTMVIMSIIILLMNEKSDFMLILALLYIMM